MVTSTAGKTQEAVVVIGMGQIGRPLFQILERAYSCVAMDLEPVEFSGEHAIMHICYPFQIADFIGTTVRYIEKYQPALTIINSTVAPGTTRKIQDAAGGRPVAYSPVRGKHARMGADMLRYKKFVGAPRPEALRKAAEHFRRAGFATGEFKTPELAELAKLLETTYLGVLVAWAQEVERFANEYGGTFDDVNAFVEEVGFLPSHIYPGPIGGHCVMPNVAILQSRLESKFLDAIVDSNRRTQEQRNKQDRAEPQLASAAAANIH